MFFFYGTQGITVYLTFKMDFKNGASLILYETIENLKNFTLLKFYYFVTISEIIHVRSIF
jgi:hypothetical protein